MRRVLFVSFFVFCLFMWSEAAYAATATVNLSWTDNAINEDAYKVEKKVGAGAYAEIASLTANATSYADAGNAIGSTICYRVRAAYQSLFSGYSNESCHAIFAPADPTGLNGTVTIVP